MSARPAGHQGLVGIGSESLLGNRFPGMKGLLRMHTTCQPDGRRIISANEFHQSQQLPILLAIIQLATPPCRRPGRLVTVIPQMLQALPPLRLHCAEGLVDELQITAAAAARIGPVLESPTGGTPEFAGILGLSHRRGLPFKHLGDRIPHFPAWGRFRRASPLPAGRSPPPSVRSSASVPQRLPGRRSARPAGPC